MERHLKYMNQAGFSKLYSYCSSSANFWNTNQMPPHILGETLQIEYNINTEIGKGKRSHEFW